MNEPRWLMNVTEHVHQMREQSFAAYQTAAWMLGVSLTPQIDHALLRLRGRYAYAMPGVRVE